MNSEKVSKSISALLSRMTDVMTDESHDMTEETDDSSNVHWRIQPVGLGVGPTGVVRISPRISSTLF